MANAVVLCLLAYLSWSLVQASYLTCLSWPSDSKDAKIQQICNLNRGLYNDIEKGTIMRAQHFLLDASLELKKYSIQLGFQTGSLVTIYELNVWHDTIYCLMNGTREDSDANRVAHQCMDGFMNSTSLVQPVMLLSKDAKEPVLSNLTTIAPLLIPIGFGDDSAAEVPDNSTQVSLEIPGTEESETGLRIFQLVNGTSQVFEDEINAETVKEGLSNATWTQQNCQPCDPPTELSPDTSTSSSRMKRKELVSKSFNRRAGASLNFCCIQPGIKSLRTGVPLDQLARVRRRKHRLTTPLAVYDSRGWPQSPEPDRLFTPPPVYPRLKWTQENSKSILEEIEKQNTVLMELPGDIKHFYPMDQLFQDLRDMFTRTTPQMFAASEHLKVVQTGPYTWNTNSVDWFSTTPTDGPQSFPNKLHLWCQLVDEFILDSLQSTDLFDWESLTDMAITTEITYLAPPKVNNNGEEIVLGETIGGSHIEYGLMTFEISDQPGTVIFNADKQSIRLPLSTDAFYLFKGMDWDGPWKASKHTVAVPDLLQNGRISIKMTVDLDDGELVARHRSYWKDGQPPIINQ